MHPTRLHRIRAIVGLGEPENAVFVAGVRQARSGPKNYMMHILIVIGFWAVFCGSAEMSRVSIEVVESIVNGVLFTSTVRRHQSRWVCQCRMDACGCVFKIFVNWRITCRREP